ncbi:MAG: BREX-1 system adenine-specific DNA-methyltransferase PglX, partial [Rhodoferax sp.]
MNKAALKSYAPQARKDFIAAVTARANLLGLSEKAGALDVAPAQPQGDVVVIAGQAWPIKVQAQREQLIWRIRKDGLNQTMEAVAYTWFNRFAALRYMELHDYLGHGHRALSSSAGGLPDILTHATDLTNSDVANALPGLNAARVTELKLAGNRDGELYRMLLVAQCNALSRAMPFLFERIDDDSELLLPDNLLRTDSIIAQLVNAIDEDDWKEVEIIGWLYQFYISEKKDQVIGKVVKSEDIPAATQLFTPNWIVQYLVQNSVGRLWLMANPQSTLAQEWPYYITPAEQTPEVQAQLDALIQTRVREDGDTLNPESITVLDPACGSGHILVVAYDVLKAIYLERGYRVRDIPRLILEKNLYGLDIDDRAAQMAGFALLMKARADDRRLFTATDDAGNLQPPKLNVLSLQESKGLSVDSIAQAINSVRAELVEAHVIRQLVETFEHAKTFGSLIQIPYALKTQLAVLPQVLALVKQSGELYASAAADDLLPLVQQAQVLAMQFDAVVANPPYMGGNSMPAQLKQFALASYPEEKNDLYAAMLRRAIINARSTGFVSFVTMHMWMYISAFESMRKRIIGQNTLVNLCHLGAGAFSEISGEVVKTAAFVFQSAHVNGYLPTFFNLQSGDEEKKSSDLKGNIGRYQRLKLEDFYRIPATVMSYQASPMVVDLFESEASLASAIDVREGMTTADNGNFLRMWWEVNSYKVGVQDLKYEDAKKSNLKWWRYQKGGEGNRWYGNNEYVVNWLNDGAEIRKFSDVTTGRIRSHNYNDTYSCRDGATWSTIGGASLAVRYAPPGGLFDTTGIMGFARPDVAVDALIAFLNSKPASYLLQLVSPMLRFKINQLISLPFVKKPHLMENAMKMAREAINICKLDWDEREISMGFEKLMFASTNSGSDALQIDWKKSDSIRANRFGYLIELEEKNNQLFIDAYGLQSELSPEVPESQITLARTDREKDCQRLISYAIGCMMGRYSLDEPGLIYAHAGNVGFEPGRYATFPADADGIVPITDELWFADDACSRIREFLRAVWGPDTLEENMTWLAESLGTKASETPDETIRRYIADKFFKDHLQTYKKRPIYWLFSSGKQGAFQALVYLHRYFDGTLARLRAEYVVPLTGKIQSRIEMLQKDAAAASSTAA